MRNSDNSRGEIVGQARRLPISRLASDALALQIISARPVSALQQQLAQSADRRATGPTTDATVIDRTRLGQECARLLLIVEARDPFRLPRRR